jgi:2-C-methyl-D-erythritol 4-phosphate cytidylyltransferase/2-C-methyl-D-erythritol 2,4-cyclodiphosphate synthase
MTKPSNLSFTVLIVAAGRGARFGSETPKQYHTILGKSVIRHTLEHFQSHPNCTQCYIVINPDDADLYHDAVSGLSIPSYIEGSTTRKLSVIKGLESLSHLKSEDVVLIHDAARPCITQSEISALAEAAHKHKAASLATPVADTLKIAESKIIERSQSRANLWSLQTPQGFHYGLIIDAHKKAHDGDATDDTSLVQDLGYKVTLVEGRRSNIKITTQDDLIMAQAIIAQQTATSQETRTGLGYDVHAFETSENSHGTLRLCGIDIPHELALKGHSDADVGLHTITDALYGAIGTGDIGTHFPPSDNSFKNMDSAVFLKHACNMIKELGGRIINIDLTLICEAPKIGPYREAILKRLSDIMNLSQSRISIKATTSEKLGFTGRKEGIAAQAVANVSIPVQDGIHD